MHVLRCRFFARAEYNDLSAAWIPVMNFMQMTWECSLSKVQFFDILRRVYH